MTTNFQTALAAVALAGIASAAVATPALAVLDPIPRIPPIAVLAKSHEHATVVGQDDASGRITGKISGAGVYSLFIVCRTQPCPKFAVALAASNNMLKQLPDMSYELTVTDKQQQVTLSGQVRLLPGNVGVGTTRGSSTATPASSPAGIPVKPGGCVLRPGAPPCGGAVAVSKSPAGHGDARTEPLVIRDSSGSILVTGD